MYKTLFSVKETVSQFLSAFLYSHTVCDPHRMIAERFRAAHIMGNRDDGVAAALMQPV